MLQILPVWFFFGLLCLFLGRILEKIITRYFFLKGPVSPGLLLWCGMAFLYVLLSLITFILPLNATIKPFIWLGFIVWMFLEREIIQEITGRMRRVISTLHPFSWVLFCSTALIALIKCAGPPEIFDEGAYHLPLIRMWENMGIIPGFANLNAHYGLHSGWHILSAFSNPGIIPGLVSDMALNGFLAACLGLFSASRLSAVIRGQSCSASALIAVFLPFFLFRNLLSSPSTDVPAILGTWFFFLFWMESAERGSTRMVDFFLFLLMPVFLLILKASSAGILSASAGFLLLQFRKGKAVLPLPLLLISGIPVFLWIIQNWLISGYAFFPFSFSALGQPDWLVPAESLQKKFFPEQFGAFAPPPEYSLVWLKTWFSAHNPDSRIIILLAGLFFMGAPVSAKWFPPMRSGSFRAMHLLLLTLSLIWFFTVTEPRYGFGALVVSALFLPVLVLRYGIAKWSALRFVVLLILPLMLLNLHKTRREFPSFTRQIFLPAPVPQVNFRNLRCGNFWASSPLSYGSRVPAGKPVFCWDCPFPCFPLEGIEDSSFVFEKKIAWFTGFTFSKK